MRPDFHKPATCLRTLLLLCVLSTSPTSWCQNSQPPSTNPIVPAYPVGSCSYFAISTLDSEGQPTTQLVLATYASTRTILRQYDKRAAQAERAAEQGDDPPAPLRIQHFTVTVWSDGKIETTTLTPTREEDLETMMERFTAQIENRPVEVQIRPHPQPQQEAPNAEPQSYNPGDQCHARTRDGSRCSRAAKGTSGFCHQHQRAADSYPTATERTTQRVTGAYRFR